MVIKELLLMKPGLIISVDGFWLFVPDWVFLGLSTLYRCANSKIKLAYA